MTKGRQLLTLCHKYTRDLTRHTIGADILIVAAGVPGLITGQMVKEGAVVIDVGMNRVADPSVDRGYRLVWWTATMIRLQKKPAGLPRFPVE